MQENNIIHSFKIVDDFAIPNREIIFPSVEMKISSQAGLWDMLDAFKSFLSAIGYSVPEDKDLGFIDNDSILEDKDDGDV